MVDACPRIVVAGGGLSGLTTAYRLLTEARDRVGGMAVAFKLGGHTVEHGSHGFFGSGEDYYVNSVALTRELGTFDTLYRVPGWTLVQRDGRRALITNSPWLPRLLDVVPSILRVPWLSPRERVRASWAALRIALLRYERYRALDAENGY